MKKIFFLGIIVCACILSCSKDVGSIAVVATPPPSTPVPLPLGPDTIVYTNPTDIYLVSPTGPNFPCPLIPLPLDTLFSDSVDIDADGTFDLKFSDKHFIYGISASAPCSTYRASLYVEGLSSNVNIARNPSSTAVVGLYLNDSISSNYDYSSPAFMRGLMFGAPDSFGPYNVTTPGDYYLGIRMIKSGKTMYGWLRLENTGINGIIIKDYAINLTNGNPILAGQTL